MEKNYTDRNPFQYLNEPKDQVLPTPGLPGRVSAWLWPLFAPVILLLFATLSVSAQCDATNDLAQTSFYNYFIMFPDTPVTVMALQGGAELPLHNHSNHYQYIDHDKK